MNPVYDFTGQVARITGASSGIGLAAAARQAIGVAAAMMMSRANRRAVRRTAAQQGARLCGQSQNEASGTTAARRGSAGYRVPVSSPIIRGSLRRPMRGSVAVHYR
jgi:NAD(P)-dependent dehydrogenase (short-subunit alcohol dehydrogenase family)